MRFCVLLFGLKIVINLLIGVGIKEGAGYIMVSEVYDWTLRDYLQQVISSLPASQRKQLKSMEFCGTNMKSDSVVVLSNGKRSTLHGTMTCKNTFACPCCSARMMSKYAAEIAVGIDLLRSENYFGFMITFSVPHHRMMTCREVTDYLYDTHKYFRQLSNMKRRSMKIQQMFVDLEIKHSVSVCEYTWGENGWHPHLHCIYWVPRANKDKILKWEKPLNEFWVKTAMRKIQEKRPGENVKYRDDNQSVFISKNPDGTIMEALSSNYMCGWSADKEVTSNIAKEASHEGHYTPYQILKLAANGNKAFEKLYIEFCLAVRMKPVHHRVRWSQSGIKAKIKAYKQVIHFKEMIKQKKIAQNEGKWEIVCWFDKEQWLYIQKNYHNYFLSNILYLAAHDKKLLYEYMENMEIDYNTRNMYYNYKGVEKIYNYDRMSA